MVRSSVTCPFGQKAGDAIFTATNTYTDNKAFPSKKKYQQTPLNKKSPCHPNCAVHLNLYTVYAILFQKALAWRTPRGGQKPTQAQPEYRKIPSYSLTSLTEENTPSHKHSSSNTSAQASTGRSTHGQPSSRTVASSDTVNSSYKSMGNHKEKSGRYTTHSHCTVTNGSPAPAAPAAHKPLQKLNQHKGKKAQHPAQNKKAKNQRQKASKKKTTKNKQKTKTRLQCACIHPQLCMPTQTVVCVSCT
ncbi:hypothetical protein MOQ_006146 [Trypanosoma cruzi marinkellei]|uniref:Uncharacterized protein n=1 Tax=Trypanosoma cruzi marinkellei TaxID=85056 RepID=K2M588_TRYCR|nr:hypothetical protein MOQ_006146 [Trypanosoma cruzi marinkellei]